ncbi:unnamed protein product [Paramecium sonneborni]|nr:unnamed protein product [Paramecium sonneborni]
MIKEIQDLKKELQNQEKQIRDLQIKIQNLTKEHFNEKMKMNQLIQQLQLENLNKTDQLNQISMYSNQTNQTNKINKENQQLKNENQNLLTKITQLQQIQDDSKSQIFKLNDLKEDLQNQTNQFKIQLNSSEEQKRLLLITIESIKNQNNQLCFDQHDCISQINFNQIQELLIDALIKKKKVQYQSQQKQLMPLNKLKVFNTILQNYLLIIYQKQLSELIRTLRNASLPIFQCSLVNCNFVFISRDGNQSCQVDNHYFCPICEISCNFKRL